MKYRRRLLGILSVVVWLGLFLPQPSQTNSGIKGEVFARSGPYRTDDPATTLTICLGEEPDTLYLYNQDANVNRGGLVHPAIYDGPFDNRSFGYQAIILEKIPSLADGDALVQPVTVKQGDTVLDADLNVVSLEPGVKVVLSGEIDPVTYAGGEIELDQMMVTFTLKTGLTWSDGTPLTADDSVYSFNLFVHPDTPIQRINKSKGERTYSYTASDNTTTVWVGLPGYRDVEYFTNFWTPLPEHVWGQYTAAQLVTAEVSAHKPIGWGPYVIDEWVTGDRISLNKNPNYFRATESLPRFDYLVYKFVGEDTESNIAALLSGECDIIDGMAILDPQKVLDSAQQGSIQVFTSEGTVYEHVDFGIQRVSYDDGYDGGISDRPDFFSDVRVRQAFAYCMDRQKVVDEVYYGLTHVMHTYVPNNHPLLNENARTYPYDPPSGRTLLSQVGWVDQDGDGVREAHGVLSVPEGTGLEVDYGTTDVPLRIQIAQILVQSLSECGIKVNLHQYPANEWFRYGPDGLLFGRQFDLGEFAYLSAYTPPCDLYLGDNVPGPEGGTWIPIMDPGAGPQTFTDSQTDGANWGGLNETGYFNTDYDLACDAARQSLPGQPSYSSKHLEAQRIFADDLPIVPLLARYKIVATRNDVSGMIMDPTDSEFWNIEDFGRYTISGRVQESSGEPVTVVTIQVGESDTLTPDASGYFTFTTVLAGTYTLTPSLTDMSDYTVFPPDRTVTLPPSAGDMDFVVAQDYDTVDQSGSEGIIFGDPADNQVTVEVPVGAVTEETTLLYTPFEAVDEVGFAGFSFGLSAYQNDEPVEDFIFEEPVVIRVDYDEADVAGVDENNLRLLSWTGTTWEDAACGVYERHPDENWLSVPVCHLSKFGLFDRQELFLPVVLSFVF